MIYRIEKEVGPGFDRLVCEDAKTSVLINRLGCEAVGYDVWDPEHGKILPLLWNNNNVELPFKGAWKNHATLLFPVAGGTRNGRTRYKDVEILSPSNHGFARNSLFTLADASTDDCAKAVYRLTDSPETRKGYPFGFLLELTYTLKDDSLSLSFFIKNTNQREMPVQFGWHPGFSTEMGLGGKRKDWSLVFPTGDYLRYFPDDRGDSFLTEKTEIVRLDGPVRYTDHELFCTLMYEINVRANRRCRIYNPLLRRGVEVRFPGFQHVCVWANVGQEYICIEPWQGLDDHEKQRPFDRRVGTLILEPGRSITRMASIHPVLG